ncbi:VOC family protein [Klebsiella variicola]|uniref:VOC family protein n=1 Tax=Klebsiella variicola TaxID=244366 RepID=UPI001CCA7C6D|nr:VOC family protein [Klebsiella variicola]EKZ6698777.1 VOC family protein [Klebsiella variicola]MBZ7795267.1 VOC family protein [Klebsiella variicola]MBZ7859281.1 VOC family protein [Klebsiella variicola]MCC7620018.1 VOC family protein [Klebsiella variicola]MCC7650381.1 VOC family protein [Klebsiella variicola]
MEEFVPSAAIAHFVMKVKDIESSYAFYQGLGLRGIDKFPEMAIIELRGGTHLLLAAKDDPMAGALHASRVGQRTDFISEKIDLMIAGHTRADLEKYRAELMANGYSPADIAEAPLYGHDYFSMLDPDGHGVSVYTSHCGDKPV